MEALVYTFLLVSTLGIISLSFFENHLRFRLKK
uniref:Photosystem II protein T n=1 Tax=Allium schoenoprasoides TaxID=166822 RepID=A0A6M8TVM0_9ASPA|nr:photosystem II protein T [Allium schoenoprasoides]QKJ81152.1 photosystem II protein T [Allium schoenoprasoides]